ncbi:capsule assembly Wzi family protein [Candidatus Marinimicrobia bacterium]|nr:capsule assembly Wzi family protein [Candidatus Neomarinimicrobiota bacterium]
MNENFKKFIIIILCIINVALSQEHTYKIEVLSPSSNNEYWWLTRNNKGMNTDKHNINFGWNFKNASTNYKITLSNSFSDHRNFNLGESFIKYNFSNSLFLRVGKYYRDFSLYLNDDLSSGSMLVSNNAQALPKMGLVGSFKTKKRKDVSFVWGISHGVFKKNEYYSDAPFLHEKFLYLNIVKSDFNSFSVGLVHEAIWAGTTTDLGSYNNPGNQPDSFKDFLKVFISADGPLLEGEPHANALGSHSGIWDFSYTKKYNKKELKLYYQHYFEDTSSLRFANKTDGLWGIELTNYLPKTNLLIEYLDTSHCCIDPPYQDDNYYWNYQYRDGWKYKNLIMGNPFVNNDRGRDEIKLIHLGVSTHFKKSILNLKASKKINQTDFIKYKISLDRKIDEFSINIFLVGNEKDSGVGMGLSYVF